jgi:hypothetical protein
MSSMQGWGGVGVGVGGPYGPRGVQMQVPDQSAAKKKKGPSDQVAKVMELLPFMPAQVCVYVCVYVCVVCVYVCMCAFMCVYVYVCIVCVYVCVCVVCMYVCVCVSHPVVAVEVCVVEHLVEVLSMPAPLLNGKHMRIFFFPSQTFCTLVAACKAHVLSMTANYTPPARVATLQLLSCFISSPSARSCFSEHVRNLLLL